MMRNDRRDRELPGSTRNGRQAAAAAVAVLTVSLVLTGCSGQNSAEGISFQDTQDIGWESIPEEDGTSVAGDNALQTETETGNQDPDAAVSSVTTESDTGEEEEAAETKEEEAADPGSEEDSSMPELETALNDELSGLSGTWAVYVKDTDTGKTVSIGNHSMVSASLIKLYIAGAYYDAVQSGTIEDTYGSTIDIMLDRSDNDAANTLIDLLGYQTINTFIDNLDLSDQATILNRKMLEQSPNENYTSVEDCGQVLEMVLDGSYVNSEASARILDDLKAQQRTSKIPAGVPSGIETANKTGELSNVENDAAIIWGPDCTYILVIMSNDLADTAAARSEITHISSMVYDTIG